MLGNAVAHLPGQIETLPVPLQHVHDAQALLVVVEPARDQLPEHPLAGVAERCVPEVVRECDRFGQLLVEPQHLRDRPRDLRHLERMGQAGAVVVARRREKHLGLVLQPAERLRVDDTVAIALKRRPDRVVRFGPQAAPAVRALRCPDRQRVPLARLEVGADGAGS